MAKKKKQIPVKVSRAESYIKDFFDMVAPATIKFNADHFIFGDTYRCVWAVREYPPQTNDQAILCHVGDKENVTIHIYARYVDNLEQRRIFQNAQRKNSMLSASNDLQEAVNAEGNLQDVATLMAELRKNKEPLIHCAVFIEMRASSLAKLEELQTEVSMELTRERITVDRLTMRQQEGFRSVSPCGHNAFASLFERVLPASSVANLYPLNYSGKTDPNGFYIGKDRYGTNIIVDFDRRSDDKTNSNILILGNSGQGKSFLMKLLLVSLRQSGKSIIVLDAEQEYEELCNNLGGCYLDLMSGKYIINPLQPKKWTEHADAPDADSPETFRKSTMLSQHISYLKDFFRAYKDFSDAHIDALEILVTRLYNNFGINDDTDFSRVKNTDYPIMADLYDLAEEEYRKYAHGSKSLFTEDLLREICLGINSMCKGAESKFFNGHTNIDDDKFLCFGVKGLMESNKKLKDAMLFNILSFMNHTLLTKGSSVAAIDELYLFLTNITAIEYIRNASKRVRKKDSSIILASQNIEDFLIGGIREYTKPLFSIPTHHFLFNPGNIDPKEFMDVLQIEEAEFDLIKHPERGVCLYKCGNERYLLQVIAPEYKRKLFGEAGGR
jgi:type IV secretory pathway VirB4 component